MNPSEKSTDDGSTSGERKRLVPPTELYAGWVDRGQRSRGRQAAISRNLYTWSNYKNWADKVRGTWESDKAPDKK